MPYVERDGRGAIVTLSKLADYAGAEFLPAQHPEVLAFIAEHETGSEEVHRALQNSDSELARVTEDLIHLLVAKNVICFTDLPEAVQSKLLSREQLRAQLSDGVSSPLSDDETI